MSTDAQQSVSIYLLCYLCLSIPWSCCLRYRIPFFFSSDSDIFLSNLILITTSLAIHYSQNVLRGFSILVCIGLHVFFRGFFFTPSLPRDVLSRSLRASLRLTEKRWKIAPVLQIQTSLMKVRVHGFLFLVFLHIKTEGKNKTFFITTSTFR